ncbi:hypothetical protein D9M68_581930 [compost metagenome]
MGLVVVDEAIPVDVLRDVRLDVGQVLLRGAEARAFPVEHGGQAALVDEDVVNVEIAMNENGPAAVLRGVVAQPVQQPAHVGRRQVALAGHVAIPAFEVVAVAVLDAAAEDARVLVALDVVGEHLQGQGVQLAETLGELHEQVFVGLTAETAEEGARRAAGDAVHGVEAGVDVAEVLGEIAWPGGWVVDLGKGLEQCVLAFQVAGAVGHDRRWIGLAHHQLAWRGRRVALIGGEVGLLAKATSQWLQAGNADAAVAARQAIEEVLQRLLVQRLLDAGNAW